MYRANDTKLTTKHKHTLYTQVQGSTVIYILEYITNDHIATHNLVPYIYIFSGIPVWLNIILLIIQSHLSVAQASCKSLDMHTTVWHKILTVEYFDK